MLDGYLYSQEVLSYRSYIVKRLMERITDPAVISSGMDEIILKLNVDFLASGDETPIKELIDAIFKQADECCPFRKTRIHSF